MSRIRWTHGYRGPSVFPRYTFTIIYNECRITSVSATVVTVPKKMTRCWWGGIHDTVGGHSRGLNPGPLLRTEHPLIVTLPLIHDFE